jgi:hypothetical protein
VVGQTGRSEGVWFSFHYFRTRTAGVLPLGGAVVGVAGWNITIDSGDVKVRHTVGS